MSERRYLKISSCNFFESVHMQECIKLFSFIWQTMSVRGNEYVVWIDYKLSATSANNNATSRIEKKVISVGFLLLSLLYREENVVNISDMLLFMLFVHGTFIHRNAKTTVTSTVQARASLIFALNHRETRDLTESPASTEIYTYLHSATTKKLT